MKRRTFLSAAGTVGIIGAASATTVVSSVYTNLGTQAILEDFHPTAKIAFEKFMNDAIENTDGLGLNRKIAKNLARPVQIVRKDKKDIIYKNGAGQQICISVKNGKSKLTIQ